MDFFMRSEWKMGDVGTEPPKDPATEQLKKLHDEFSKHPRAQTASLRWFLFQSGRITVPQFERL
eukprot:Skav215288  [mRNA]  locus=scaffold2522:192308:192499:- [translate_table: standard]